MLLYPAGQTGTNQASFSESIGQEHTGTVCREDILSDSNVHEWTSAFDQPEHEGA